MNKTWLTVIGFILFLVGGISIVLTLVGLRLTILSPIESLGTGIAFLIKILILVFGLILTYLARTTIDE
jgi:hypothetical protein